VTGNEKIVAANTRFGFRLFAEVARQDSGKNVLISPVSVAFALSMAYNGASGETRQAMAASLELQGMSLEEINEGNAILRETLENAGPQVQLAIANSLWARKGIAIKKDFIRRSEGFYAVEVREIDPADPGAAPVINSWVSEKTRGKIDRIVERLAPDMSLLLINAIYFKGNWARPFDDAKTEKRAFTLPDGSQKQHPMMSQRGRYRYYRADDFQAVRLPYSQGRMSMYIFLPSRDSSLTEFQRNLTAESWEAWMTRFRSMEGQIILPRFKLEYEKTLNEALGALGMTVAFDRARADFEDLCPTPPRVWIDEVKHKTFAEVNEEGTEAAAVTAVGFAMASLVVQQPFRMIVDRPFFCAIRDDETGAVLFMGSIVEPK
jgi:serine protease inhibitor